MRIKKFFDDNPSKKAVIPFLTAGDPDIGTSLEIMKTLVKNGADIIELGVPFSDPMADGPVIQLADERALANGTSLKDVLSLVEKFREEDKDTPVVLMGYMNPFHHMGLDEFAKEAKRVGVDGVLAVDCPVEYIDFFQDKLKANGIDTIFLIAPTTSDERVKLIFEKASGYVYYVSLKGVTGSNVLNTEEVAKKVSHFKNMTDLPIAVGFGIKSGETAKAVAQVADAVIVGSHFVDTVFKHPEDRLGSVGKAVKEIRDAVDEAA